MMVPSRALRHAGALLLVLLLARPAPAERLHVVAPGDTLLGLAERYATTVEALRGLNGLQGSLIRVGQELRVPDPPRVGWRVHRTGAGETLADVAALYGVSEAALAAANALDGVAGPLGRDLALHVPPGEGPVVRLGPGESVLGLAARHGVAPSELVRLNGFVGLDDAAPGDPVLLPPGTGGAAVGAGPTTAAAAPGAAAPAGSRPAGHHVQQLALLARAAELTLGFEPSREVFALPLRGRLTSPYGWRSLSVNGNHFHGGLDIAAAPGVPVRAARDGVVARTGWVGAYGYAVFLDHGDGTQTRYAHLSRIEAQVGGFVRQGDVLGRVGSTGVSTGPHLHFEIRVAGVAVDPLPYLPWP